MPNATAIRLTLISESKINPRRKETATELADLILSIEQHGVIQPITLRKVGKDQDRFEIICGHRRFWATQLIQGRIDIPANIINAKDDEVPVIQLIENLQRKDIDPMLEAEFFNDLMKDKKNSPESIGAKIGKHPSYIIKRMKLTSLIQEAKAKFMDKIIPLSHALEIARLQPDDQRKVIGRFMDNYDIPTLSSFRNGIKENILHILSKAPFDIKDAELMPKAGACTECPFNTACASTLFGDLSEKAACTKPSCYEEKSSAHITREIDIAEKEGIKLVLLADEYWSDNKKLLTKNGFRQSTDKKDPLGIFVEGDRFGQKIHFKNLKDESRSGSSSPKQQKVSQAAREKRKKEIFNNRVEQNYRELLRQSIVEHADDMRIILIGVLSRAFETGPFTHYTYAKKEAFPAVLKLANIKTLPQGEHSKKQRLDALEKLDNKQLRRLAVAVSLYDDRIVDPFSFIPSKSHTDFFLKYCKKVDEKSVLNIAKAIMSKKKKMPEKKK